MAQPVTMSAESFDPRPEINTTPLIDVMLVLLIMFIMVIPVSTEQVPIDLPVDDGTVIDQTHRLDLDAAGRVYWDGAPVGAAELRERLVQAAADPAEPALHINADPETRYERFDETLAAVKGAGITRLGFVDNGRFVAAIDGH